MTKKVKKNANSVKISNTDISEKTVGKVNSYNLYVIRNNYMLIFMEHVL